MTDKIVVENELTKKEKVKYGIVLGLLSILTLVFNIHVMRIRLIFYVDIPFYLILFIIFAIFFFIFQNLLTKIYIVKSATMFTLILSFLWVISSILFNREWCLKGFRSGEWNCKVLFNYEMFLGNFARGYTGVALFYISLFSFIILFIKSKNSTIMKHKKVVCIKSMYFVLLIAITFFPYLYKITFGDYIGLTWMLPK